MTRYAPSGYLRGRRFRSHRQAAAADRLPARRNRREAIYDRHRYQREIKAALALWAEHVLALFEGRDSKLVSLHA
jgi:hypothetical protein